MHMLILGAGYAGLRVALELQRKLTDREHQARVTLIDRHSHHQIITLLHRLAAATVPEEETRIPLAPLFAEDPAPPVHLLQGTVRQIRPDSRQVVLNDGQEQGQKLSYDRLILAVGATTDYYNIPGAEAHTLPLRTVADAVQLREHMTARFREAASTSDPAARRALLTTAIIGGGATGCQIAGELAAWAPRLAREYGLPRNDIRVALIERMPRLLNEYRAPWASREALRVLDCRGVSVYLDTAVERVEEGNLFVNDRRMMRAATMVWSAGIRAPQLLADAGLPTDARGRVHVNSFLQLEAYPDIYAIGDCAQIPDTMGGIVPTTASYAIRQGAFLADALIDELDGRPPASRYGYEPLALGSVVSLGPSAAVGDVLGVPVRGAVAALMKHTVEQQYRKSLR